MEHGFIRRPALTAANICDKKIICSRSVGSAPPSGVMQEVLCPFMEAEQEQSEDVCMEADCAAPFIHYEP